MFYFQRQKQTSLKLEFFFILASTFYPVLLSSVLFQVKVHKEATFHAFLSSLLFENNGDLSSTRFGGAIAITYEDLIGSQSLLVVNKSKFINCSAEYGAAMYISVRRGQRGSSFRSRYDVRNFGTRTRTNAEAMRPVLLDGVDFINNTANLKGTLTVVHAVIEVFFW